MIVVLLSSVIIYLKNQLMMEEKIKIRLPNARQKLQSLFPEDSRGDIRIEFGQRSFKLQKAFLRLESAYFKRAFSANSQVLSITQKFNPHFFTNVLRCFYGFTIELSRSEVVQYYPIVKFLEVESLIKVMREDMISKAEQYDIFVLMQLAHRFDQQQIFEVCLAHLDKEEFQQLRYAKLELLRCPMELFKMVIKTHNRMKAQKHKGVPFLEIDQLIKDFSDQKKLNQAQYQQLKFELIDKNSLSSQEYKEIFLDDAKRKKTNQYCSMIRVDQAPVTAVASTMKENPFISSRLTQSLINPMQKINDELTLEMEHTWEKKKNQELKAQNEFLFKELEELKDATSKNKKMFEELKELVMKLQKQLDDREKVDKEQASTIKKLTKMCEDLKKELNQKGDVIKKLEEKVGRLEKAPQKTMPIPGKNSKFINIDDDAEESRTIQSQIVPSHLLRDFAKPAAEALTSPPTNTFKKAKPQPTVMAVIEAKVQEDEQPDEESIEEMYISRLDFDTQPKSCPKKMLPNLANFLTTDGFSRKTLNLIFRRNISNQDSKGSPSDLFNKNSLLVLICTRMNQVVGGFTSIEIEKNQKDYIKDSQAFVFSLTKNQKFNIKKNSASEAIFITSDYLICFSNDLMISADCIKTQSQSDWPCAYESGAEKRTSKWLTGEQGGFSIKEIQVYEVKEEAMIMDL